MAAHLNSLLVRRQLFLGRTELLAEETEVAAMMLVRTLLLADLGGCGALFSARPRRSTCWSTRMAEELIWHNL